MQYSEARIAALQLKHQTLEGQIDAERSRPQPDASGLVELRWEKLRIKDELGRLQSQLKAPAGAMSSASATRNAFITSTPIRLAHLTHALDAIVIVELQEVETDRIERSAQRVGGGVDEQTHLAFPTRHPGDGFRRVDAADFRGNGHCGYLSQRRPPSRR